MANTAVVANLRQPNKYYRCFDITITPYSYQDIDVTATLGVTANTVSITNESDLSMQVILNSAAYDRIPLEKFAELSWRRDELQIDWIRIYNNGSESGRVIVLTTG